MENFEKDMISYASLGGATVKVRRRREKDDVEMLICSMAGGHSTR